MTRMVEDMSKEEKVAFRISERNLLVHSITQF